MIGWQIQAAVDLARGDALVSPVTCQAQYSLLSRGCEWEIVEACRHNGVGLLPWSPLAGGLLTGKYAKDQPPSGDTRLGGSRLKVWYAPMMGHDRTWAVIETVGEMAASRGVTSSQVALAWLSRKEVVSSVVLGPRTIEQLVDNLGAADVSLDAGEIEHLDELSRPAADYPYGGLALVQRARNVDGSYVLNGADDQQREPPERPRASK